MYKVKGKLKSISDKKTLDNGAVILDYVLEETSENGFVTLYAISMYKKPEFSNHVDNFIEYNKIGGTYEVEFTIRSSEYNGRVYNNLNHWRIESLETTAPVLNGEKSDLPF